MAKPWGACECDSASSVPAGRLAATAGSRRLRFRECDELSDDAFRARCAPLWRRRRFPSPLRPRLRSVWGDGDVRGGLALGRSVRVGEALVSLGDAGVVRLGDAGVGASGIRLGSNAGAGASGGADAFGDASAAGGQLSESFWLPDPHSGGECEEESFSLAEVRVVAAPRAVFSATAGRSCDELAATVGRPGISFAATAGSPRVSMLRILRASASL